MRGLRLQREAKGMSQMVIAQLLGVTQGCVSQWEKGTSMPRADKLMKLAGLLGCTVDELLGNDPAEAAG